MSLTIFYDYKTAPYYKQPDFENYLAILKDWGGENKDLEVSKLLSRAMDAGDVTMLSQRGIC